jgi:uncharacterized protein Yka (UPF0111/DUF47 family)
MFAWLGRLMPREERFFGLFEEHAENLVSGADALRALLDAKASGEESCERLTEIDLQAKKTAATVMDAVYGTFVTPFDWVDIEHLVRSIDGALDQMRRAARTVTVAGVEDLRPNIQSLGHIAVNCACLVKEAAPLLSDIDKHADELREICTRIAAENEEGERLLDRGVADLFRNGNGYGNGDAIAFVASHSVYQELGYVVSRLDQVGDQIQNIVIDHV